MIAASIGTIDSVYHTTTYAIGDSALGGTIAYILQPGDPGYSSRIQHGLIIGEYVVLAYIPGPTYDVLGTSTAFGTGQSNTTAMLSYSPQTPKIADYANTYSNDGYSDWYAPSLQEVLKFIPNKTILGLGSGTQYWSSSNFNVDYAWYVNFVTDSYASDIEKYVPLGFCAVRSF
jgi:hypothetical protein